MFKNNTKRSLCFFWKYAGKTSGTTGSKNMKQNCCETFKQILESKIVSNYLLAIEKVII